MPAPIDDQPWRDKRGRFNPKGHFKVVNGKLKNLRSGSQRRSRSGAFDPEGDFVARGKRLERLHPAERTGRATGRPPARGRPPAPVPAPRPEPLGPRFRPPGRIVTYFSAMGSMGPLSELGGPNGSPPILFVDDPDFPAPLAFYSRQGSVMGQVRWEGRISLESLIARLNTQLQFFGEEVRGFDFRSAYNSWSYRYQVVRIRGLQREILEDIERGR